MPGAVLGRAAERLRAPLRGRGNHASGLPPTRSFCCIVPFSSFCIFPDTAPISDTSVRFAGAAGPQAGRTLCRRRSGAVCRGPARRPAILPSCHPAGRPAPGSTQSGAQRTRAAVAVLLLEPASFLGPGHASTTGGAGSCGGGGTRKPGMGVKWAAFGTKCSLKWL